MIGFVRKVAQGSSPAHAVLLTIFTQAFVVLLNVATGVITARLLGPDGRGIFAATTIWPQFLAGIGALGLPAAIVYYLKNHPEGQREIVGAAYLLTGVIGLVTTVAGLLLAPFAMPEASRDTLLLAEFCILWTSITMLAVVLRNILVAGGRYREFSISNYVPPFLYLIGLLVIWPLVGMTPEAAAICLMISGALATGWMFVSVHSVIRPRFSGCGHWIRQMSQFSAKLAASDLSGHILFYIDRLILIPILPANELGLYVVAYSLSRLMFVLQTAIGSVLYPAMAGREPSGIKELHDFAFRLVLYAASGAVAVIWVLAYPAVTIVYGGDFAGAVPLLKILVIEAAITCIGQVVFHLYLSLKQPGFPSVVQTLSLIVAVVCLLLLVPHYGASGAAISLVIAAFFRLAVMLVGIKIRLGMSMPRLLPRVSDVVYVRARLFRA